MPQTTDTDSSDDPVVSAEASGNRYRLPRTAVPSHYDLTLEPDLTAATFTGAAAITVRVLEPTATIVLNAIELEIHEAWLQAPTDDAARIAATDLSLDDETERLTIHFDQVIEPGSWVLHTSFAGILNDKLRGFYRSTFTDVDGVEQVIATTQMEATDARRAFPCWDEPDLKATFSVTLVVDDHLAAISNAAEIDRTPHSDTPGKSVVRFAKTMTMSTYLVAFIVGPLDVTEPVDAGGVPLRIAFPHGQGHLTDFALEVGKFCLEYFAEYYGIPYPGDKVDLVAVPDFAFGAMENLGCITFREILLLVDTDKAAQPELQNVTDVIAHELAHMWFGDLVTMKWWNGIWLNEAFATFMEMKATDAFRPEWDRWTAFGLSRTMALDVDSLLSTRPIEYPVISPADAEGMFDVLTYEKGAGVVRMLEQYLGEEAFRDGIQLYLGRHSYSNTETTDLWDALEEATDQPVRRIMDSWIFQGGCPVISVDIVDDGRTLRLSQERFTYLTAEEEGLVPDPSAEGQQWSVPLIFSQSRDGIVSFERELLEGVSIDIAEFESVDWVLGNTEGTGFYRVRYAPALRDSLVNRAGAELSSIERYGLIDDLWASVLSGTDSATHFLDLLVHFTEERDLSVWQRIIATLRSLDALIDDDDAEHGFRARASQLLTPTAEWLGADPIDDESDRHRQLRGTIFEALGTVADDAATEIRARELLRQSADGAPVDPSMLNAAINVVAATAGPEQFDDFLDRFRAATTPQEELRYLGALADFDDGPLVDRLLAMALTDEIRTQNAPYLVRRVLQNRTQGIRGWRFVVENWTAINDRFPSNSIVRMLEGVRSLSKPEVAESVFAFFSENEVPQGDRILAQHLERLEVNVALRRREAEALADHLR